MKKIFKYIFLTILVLIVALCVFNWDKVLVLKEALTTKYTQEDIENLQNKQYETLKNAAQETLEIEIRELTEEEKKALEKGEITEEDAKGIILGEKELVDGTVVQKEPEKAEQPEKTEKPTAVKPAVDKSADIISQIYVLEALYVSKLETVEDEMLYAYKLLPSKEKTTANKYKLANEAISKGSVLEKECDAKMKTLLAELEQNLKDCGKNTAIVKEIKSAYESKKKTTQAYFFQKYTNR